MSKAIRADLHGTIFVSSDKLTTGLQHDLRLVCRSEKCRSILKHVLKCCGNCKSCRRPAVSLSALTMTATFLNHLRGCQVFGEMILHQILTGIGASVKLVLINTGLVLHALHQLMTNPTI